MGRCSVVYVGLYRGEAGSSFNGEELAMTVSINTAPPSPLRQRMQHDMMMRGLGPHTQKDYVRHVKRLAAFLGRLPIRQRKRICAAFGSCNMRAGSGRAPSTPPCRPCASCITSHSGGAIWRGPWSSKAQSCRRNGRSHMSEPQMNLEIRKDGRHAHVHRSSDMRVVRTW